ncbi:MAG: kynureninase [Chitinophagales bacterium]|nr:kynureninase [Chitinophagales bacterium]MDW8419889.1 kynureninase [Chitinophagales bacterium]
MEPFYTRRYARALDARDPLRAYRKLFHIPKAKGKQLIYLCGNSLGLQPKSVSKYINTELNDWKNLGVEGHLRAKNPWYYYHHFFTDSIARLVGAKKDEVVVMNQLTVNLNLLLISFYRPAGRKVKVLMQAHEFPSDYYAVEQQIKFHGLNPNECIVEVQPRPGEFTLRTEDIIRKIDELHEELALVMFSAVNYYTGQLFEIQKISEACCRYGIVLGLDLAHAIGNVPLKLHDWNVDFATWCSYKYLNSGPGGVSGIFVNRYHAKNFDLPRLAGWWGNDEKTRFTMPKHFVPQPGAAGWQLSNAPVLSMAAHRAALDIFDRAGMKAIREKSLRLTGYLRRLIEHLNPQHLQIITPPNPQEHGAQLSIRTLRNGKALFKKITQAGVVADWREPDVIRVAPAPLYNTYEEVWRFAQILCGA